MVSYPFDQLGLGKSSRQRRDNVNVIGNTAHAQGFATLVTADRRQIGMHPGPVWLSRARVRDSSC
jgi:hypothetical protein